MGSAGMRIVSKQDGMVFGVAGLLAWTAATAYYAAFGGALIERAFWFYAVNAFLAAGATGFLFHAALLVTRSPQSPSPHRAWFSAACCWPSSPTSSRTWKRSASAATAHSCSSATPWSWRRRSSANSGQFRHAHSDPLASALLALNQQPSDLGVVVKGVALDRVEDRLGQVVEIKPGRITLVVHADLDRELAPARSRAAPFLAEELVDQRLVVLGLGGQTVDHDLEHAAGLPRAHLAPACPVVGHGGDVAASPGRRHADISRALAQESGGPGRTRSHRRAG